MLTKSPLNPLGISLRDQVYNHIIKVRGIWCIITVSEGKEGLEIYDIVSLVNLGIPFLKLGHSKDDLESRELQS